jgi:hypothetical protein
VPSCFFADPHGEAHRACRRPPAERPSRRGGVWRADRRRDRRRSDVRTGVGPRIRQHLAPGRNRTSACTASTGSSAALGVGGDGRDRAESAGRARWHPRVAQV